MDKNGFPERFEILPEPIEKLLRAGQHVGEFLLRQFMHVQSAPDRHSDHYRGASADLDKALYDSDGNYHDRMSLDEQMYDSYWREG